MDTPITILGEIISDGKSRKTQEIGKRLQENIKMLFVPEAFDGVEPGSSGSGVCA